MKELSRNWTRLYVLLSLVAVIVAVLAALAYLYSRDSSSPVTGVWVLYDGSGVQILTFDANGELAPEPGQPDSFGHGSTHRQQLTIRVSGLHNPSGELYSRIFEGTTVLEATDRPQGLTPSAIEAAYTGTLRRTDLDEYSLPATAFKVTPEFIRTSIAMSLIGTPPPAAPAPPSVPPAGMSTPTVRPLEGSAPEQPRGGVAPGKIAFHSAGIYIINPDGTGLTQLTSNGNADLSPAWSPDGSEIAFLSYRDRQDGNDIYVMQPDGSAVRRITDFEGYKGGPAWSPDGNRLAFAAGPTGPGPIYLINLDGTGLTQLTNFTAAAPDWSPDGNWLAFTCYEGSTSEVCVMSADGQELLRLTSPDWGALGPVWSPDGARIAFVRDNAIYVMKRDGSEAVRITDDLGAYPHPSWSPDGRYIAFVSNRQGGQQIYAMAADGSDQWQITTAGGLTPDWGLSPDP